MKFQVAFFTLFCKASSFALKVEGPDDQWVREGGSLTLVCRSESPLATCSWETPYNDLFTFGAAKVAEKGRIRHYASESADGLECGVIIEPLKLKDEGLWICHVGAVNTEGELDTGLGSAKLTMASKPSEVVIEHSESNVNASELVDLEVNCVARGANPKPEFVWFLEEELMENPVVETNKEGGDWIQTLILSQERFQGNGSLKCSVSHLGLAEPLEVVTAVTLSYKNLGIGSAKATEGPKRSLWFIMIVPVIVLLLGPSHFYAYRHDLRLSGCAKYFSNGSDPEDVEGGSEEPEMENEEDGEKRDQEKDEDGDSKINEANETEGEANRVEKQSAWKRLKSWISPRQLEEKKLEQKSEKVEETTDQSSGEGEERAEEKEENTTNIWRCLSSPDEWGEPYGVNHGYRRFYNNPY